MKTLKSIIIVAIASVNSSFICTAAEVEPDPPKGFIHISEKKDPDTNGEYFIQRDKITSIVVTEKINASGTELGVSVKYFEVSVNTITSNDKEALRFKFKNEEDAIKFTIDTLELP